MKNELVENTADRKYHLIFLVTIGLICILIGIFIEYSRAILLISSGIASLTFATTISVREKRISFRTIFFGIISLLFLASGVSYFAYTNQLSNNPYFLQSIRPDQIGQGLAIMGIGLLTSWFKAVQPLIENEKKNSGLIFIWLGIGILLVLLGISSLANAFHS